MASEIIKVHSSSLVEFIIFESFLIISGCPKEDGGGGGGESLAKY
jgi:hypothetical protein